MAINTSYNNLFRYIHFQPAKTSQEIVETVARNASNLIRGKHNGIDSRTKEQGELAKIKSVIKELNLLNPTKDIKIEDKITSKDFNKLTTLSKVGIDKLSKKSKEYLKSISVDLLKTPYQEIQDKLNSGISINRISGGSNFVFNNQQPNNGAAYIQAVGTAQLLVVKQQIKRYEASEIAHIENILSGEKKVRRHDQLTRSEDFYSSVSERTTEKENELESTERFELNKQISKTLQKDTQMGLELSVSGKYGPTVSFESNFNIGQNTTSSTATENATNYAKNTIERSKERILEKIAVTQEKTLIREVRERNKHILENDLNNDHTSAIYQFVDKIYESQVFDYGKRMMFDFMIPEPSSYFLYLKEKTPTELDLSKPLGLKDFEIYESKDINKYNYLSLGSYYKVKELPQPPNLYTTKRLRLSHGTGAEDDTGKHKSGVSGEVEIPSLYRPNLATISILATSDETLNFSINIGGDIAHFKKSDFIETSVSGGHKKYSLVDKLLPLGYDITIASGEKLFIDVYGYESANYNIHIDFRFVAIYDVGIIEYLIIAKWKQDIYEKLSEAHQDIMLQYEQEKSIKEAELEARNEFEVKFDAPPSVYKKMVHTELKKHCLALIRNEHLGLFNTSHSGEPPQFDITEAKENGEIIRFLEHAFEWSQLQFVLYPYFWARTGMDQKGWIDKLLTTENDFEWSEFLKSGYARVVVPVREGFEASVSYFIENNIVYNNLGDPNINDPLYVSIVDEIKERTGAGKDEIPVGAPWETKLPTSLIIVRRTSKLPEWTIKAGEDWTWEPVPEN